MRIWVEGWAANLLGKNLFGWLVAFVLIYTISLCALSLILIIVKGRAFGLVTMTMHILVILVALDRTQPGQLAKDFFEKFGGGDADARIDFFK